MDDFPDVLWQNIRESERNAPSDRPIVLVVDDDPSARLLMRYAVRNVVRTDAASTVADARRMARSIPYDGLLIDVRLPDENGMELVKQLRDRTPYWGVPIVAVTGYALPESCAHFLDAGFDAYVAKPFEQDELRTLVRHLVVDEPDSSADLGLSSEDDPLTIGMPPEESEHERPTRDVALNEVPDTQPVAAGTKE